MKQILILTLVCISFSTFAQNKDTSKAQSDTLVLVGKSGIKFVKIDKEIFSVLDISTGAHIDVEAMKKIIAEQYNAQAKKTESKE